MANITTHILDTSTGRPAQNIAISLEYATEYRAGGTSSWELVGQGHTDSDGRLKTLLHKDGVQQPLKTGIYRINFDVASYHAQQGVTGFYPEASIVFYVRDATQHYHVPLLVNPYGYSTYRGS